ncbi:type 2 lanthipeptide synthetase LanM family protein [Micromonospora sp. R77]|uniref:type 2 lanthipeptide synthetase LanM family protein n=1 Tax=Micromonospora sp. R77 TaxID=2925836 RepID=UPI001F6151D6|nr:type 2 lanthipeptide synthetase LanM family protein [Micromonospora sp. R77]MCI4066033.1 type 2 lanthipeptide synthetase LanM family protein [Micromonospora sp. R77]
MTEQVMVGPSAEQVPDGTADVSWWRAATLDERHALYDDAGPPDATGDDRAATAYREWRAQRPFTDEGIWQRRLSLGHLDDHRFRALLRPTAPPPVDGPPRWLAEFHRIIGRAADENTLPGPDLDGEDIDIRAYMLKPFTPFVADATERLAEVLDELALSDALVDRTALLRSLASELCAALVAGAQRALIVDINIARIEGRLVGTDPQARYREFLDGLTGARLQEFFATYPVLARRMTEQVDIWLAANRTFLGHLVEDWPHVVAAFGLSAQDRIEAVLPTGDSHRGGQRVSVLVLSSGAKVVYKPRPMAVDQHLAAFLERLNQAGVVPSLRLPRSVDGGDHGWQEHVGNDPCRDLAEVGDFYERHGALLAVLHLLQATDFHSENLIASGGHPVLVDLESVLQPEIVPIPDGPMHHTSELLATSVLRVGLLPVPVWATEESPGIDLSGLAARAGQRTPMPVPSVVAAGTDAIRLVLEHGEVPIGEHLPQLAEPDSVIDPLDHLDRVERGFVAVYRHLLEHRDSLVEELVRDFDSDEIRVIARATQTYATLLFEATHPWLLRDAADLERHFDRLWAGDEGHFPLIVSEQHDLRRGDIPVFVAGVSSRDVVDSTGTLVPQVLSRSAGEMVRAQVARMGEADLARQLWFLRASVADLTAARAGATRTTRERPARRPARKGTDPLAAARGIGDRLCAEAVAERDDGVSWVTLEAGQSQNWAALPAMIDLYGGLPGIALFLARLGQLTGVPRYTSTARAATRSLRAMTVGATDGTDVRLGAFSGLGGLVYTFAHLAEVWGDPELAALAADLVVGAGRHIAADEQLDLLSGSAGFVLCGLAAHALTGRDDVLDTVERAAAHLVERAVPAGDGIGWCNALSPRTPLSGMSHGSSGFALAFARLAERTGRHAHREAALAAFRHERSTWDPAKGNWRDLRDPDIVAPGRTSGLEPLGPMTTWCHGAPGIGLARLACLDVLAGDDPALAGEAAQALATTVADGFGMTFSACHGDLGNLELLLEAGRVLGPAALPTPVSGLAAEVIEAGTTLDWPSATPNGVPTPGFMIGLAGTGYQLLRLAEPDVVPSVLTLAAPTRPGVR